MIQILVLTIVLVIALIVIAAALMKKSYSISSVIIINKPRAAVFDFVIHLRNQEKYSKWVMMDPNINLNYKGTDATVGFIASWESDNKNVGVGEQEITKIVDGDRYVVEIRFKKPFKGISTAITTTKALAQNETKVTTTFHTRTPFPMNLMIPMICKMLQKDMDQNAVTLKKVLET